jgi:archaemetzincin
MRIVSLVPVGEVSRLHLELLAQGLAPTLGVACSIQSDGLDVAFAFDTLRGQYHSTEILRRLTKRPAVEIWRLLGVTEADLFIPVLTFVFGEAQLGPAPAARALVSMHRLRQEFYGLPPDPPLLSARLLKESLHELGHTVGLRHCPDYRCVMSSSHSIEEIDLKLAQFCRACATAF